MQKGRMRGKAYRGGDLNFGEYGLKSMDPGRISNRQIEAARVAIMRAVKRSGKLWVRIFPHTVITAKPTEVRMGKGKGDPAFWVAKVKPGTMMFELGGVTEEIAKEAFRLASHKLPVRTKFIARSAI